MPLTRTKPSEQLALKKPGIVFADLSNNEGQGVYHAESYCRTHPFLIHKASQGERFVDGFHAVRCEDTHKAGRAVGHYMFLSPGSTPLAAIGEAKHFLEVVKGHVLTKWPDHPRGYRADFFVIDIEVPVTQPHAVLSNIVDVLTRAYPTTTIVGYSGYARALELRLYEKSKIRKWWVAAYPGPVPKKLPNGVPIWAHQYTDKGRVVGIAAPVDKSIILDKDSAKYWTA